MKSIRYFMLFVGFVFIALLIGKAVYADVQDYYPECNFKIFDNTRNCVDWYGDYSVDGQTIGTATPINTNIPSVTPDQPNDEPSVTPDQPNDEPNDPPCNPGHKGKGKHKGHGKHHNHRNHNGHDKPTKRGHGYGDRNHNHQHQPQGPKNPKQLISYRMACAIACAMQ